MAVIIVAVTLRAAEFDVPQKVPRIWTASPQWFVAGCLQAYHIRRLKSNAHMLV